MTACVKCKFINGSESDNDDDMRWTLGVFAVYSARHREDVR